MFYCISEFCALVRQLQFNLRIVRETQFEDETPLSRGNTNKTITWNDCHRERGWVHYKRWWNTGVRNFFADAHRFAHDRKNMKLTINLAISNHEVHMLWWNDAADFNSSSAIKVQEVPLELSINLIGNHKVENTRVIDMGQVFAHLCEIDNTVTVRQIWRHGQRVANQRQHEESWLEQLQTQTNLDK